MEQLALGTPICPEKSVSSVLQAITACHGGSIEGEGLQAYDTVISSIANMVKTSRRIETAQYNPNFQSMGSSCHSMGSSFINILTALNQDNIGSFHDGKSPDSRDVEITKLKGRIDELSRCLTDNDEALMSSMEEAQKRERNLIRTNAALRVRQESLLLENMKLTELLSAHASDQTSSGEAATSNYCARQSYSKHLQILPKISMNYYSSSGDNSPKSEVKTKLGEKKSNQNAILGSRFLRPDTGRSSHSDSSDKPKRSSLNSYLSTTLNFVRPSPPTTPRRSEGSNIPTFLSSFRRNSSPKSSPIRDNSSLRNVSRVISDVISKRFIPANTNNDDSKE